MRARETVPSQDLRTVPSPHKFAKHYAHVCARTRMSELPVDASSKRPEAKHKARIEWIPSKGGLEALELIERMFPHLRRPRCDRKGADHGRDRFTATAMAAAHAVRHEPPQMASASLEDRLGT